MEGPTQTKANQNEEEAVVGNVESLTKSEGEAEPIVAKMFKDVSERATKMVVEKLSFEPLAGR